MDRSVEEATQGLVSRYHPGEPRPWLCSPCLASSCARCTALSTARSTPGLWAARGFPSALGPSHQAFLRDLEKAGPCAQAYTALPRDVRFPSRVGRSPGAVRDLNSVAAEALGLQVKTSQNTFQMEMKTRMKQNKP